MKVWIKRAVGAAALAGGLLVLGGAAQAHAAESARSASVGVCGVVGLGGSRADACASAPDAVDVKVHIRHAPCAQRMTARHARSAADRLRATAPSARAEAQLGHHGTLVDASAVADMGDTDTARARLAVRRNRAGAGAPASHNTITPAAAIAAVASLGSKDGTVTTSPAAALGLTIGTNGHGRGSQLAAGVNADLGAEAMAATGLGSGAVGNDGTTTAAGANDVLGADATGDGSAAATGGEIAAGLSSGAIGDNTTNVGTAAVGAVPLLFLGLAVLLVGVVTLARARSMAL